MEARKKNLIGHIGITNHRIQVAQDAIDSGLYETLQFPFSYLATDPEIQLVNSCMEKGMGFIAMKSLAGGLILNARAAYAFHAQFDHVVAIWGIHRPAELQDFLELSEHPSEMTLVIQELIDRDRQMLSGEFYRGCRYCMPCPSGISIPDCARMSLMIRRAPTTVFFNDEWQAKMKQIEQCINCRQCAERCPYGLDTPNLLRRNLIDYEEQLGLV